MFALADVRSACWPMVISALVLLGRLQHLLVTSRANEIWRVGWRHTQDIGHYHDSRVIYALPHGTLVFGMVRKTSIDSFKWRKAAGKGKGPVVYMGLDGFTRDLNSVLSCLTAET